MSAAEAQSLANELSQLEIAPCTAARILSMTDVRKEQRIQMAVTMPLIEAGHVQIDPQRSWCAIDPRQAAPVAAWGIFPIWPGRASAWAVFTPRAKLWAKRVGTATKFHVEQMRHLLLLRRLEAPVNAGDEPAIRWARIVGFEAESLMRSYGPEGEDYYMMAMVWP